jgi:hypothetical protein
MSRNPAGGVSAQAMSDIMDNLWLILLLCFAGGIFMIVAPFLLFYLWRGPMPLPRRGEMDE